jgi:DNA-binding SARP family transcriptional activator
LSDSSFTSSRIDFSIIRHQCNARPSAHRYEKRYETRSRFAFDVSRFTLHNGLWFLVSSFPSPMLSFHFFGSPRLERDGKPLALDTRKAFALAAYLALTQTAHQRDELAAFLYPDADAARARAALRRTLSTLKSALGDGAFEIDRESIALGSDANLQIDVLEFRRLAQSRDAADWTRAAQLYEGDFFAGFTLRDSPAFDEWQFFETESLRKQFASVLEQLVAHESARGAYKRAIEYARRWLALDALHEPAHRALMLLYARDGQRAAALRQYYECVRQLDVELGVAPLPETTELFHALQENKIPNAEHRIERTALARQIEIQEKSEPTISFSEFRTLLAEFPLVGRARELERLQDGYAKISNSGRLMIVQGEAGIGKTRLVQEFIAQAQARGAHIMVARCYAEQHLLAYAPFVEALRAALSENESATRAAALPAVVQTDAARLLPELAPDAVRAPEAPGSQARFFDAITALVFALTRNRVPGILFMDDAQWLDDASLELLAFLVRRLRRVPLCLLLAWRGEEIADDHPLRRLYADARRAQYAEWIELTRLERGPVQELIDSAAARGVPINAALAERLYQESEGQPFFLVEYLKLLEREGALPENENLPVSVRELLHTRLAPLHDAARQLLDAASVIGHSFDFGILRTASGRSEEETIAGVEELVAHGLLVETSPRGEPQYDFTHEKIRELVYQETSLARRRLLHRRTADTLAQRARTTAALDASAGQIAQHYRAGGVDTLAAEFYKRAGDYALALFANRDAVEYYTAALALGLPDAAILHQGIGDAQTLLGKYEDALRAYETAAAFGATTADARIARVYLRRGEWARAIHALQTALTHGDDAATEARLYADLSLAEHRAGDGANALRHAQRALKLAQRGVGKGAHVSYAQGLAQAQAHNILGILARTRGEWDRAREQLNASCAIAEKINATGAHAAALNNLALVYHATGEDAIALELAQRALALVTREGDRHRQAALHNHLADLYHALGRTEDSMRELKQAVAIYAEIGGEAGAWQPEIWKLEEW